VHPQLGTTDSIFNSDLPTFFKAIEREMVLSFGCLPKSIFVAATNSLGAFAGGAGFGGASAGAGCGCGAATGGAAGAGPPTGCLATVGLVSGRDGCELLVAGGLGDSAPGEHAHIITASKSGNRFSFLTLLIIANII
jgi:hypothetical protein